MLRNVGWVAANIAIAFALVAVGTAVAALAAPDEPGGVDAAVAAGFLFAVLLVPWYVPGVAVHLVAMTALRRRWSERAAALLLAPLAPGLLWMVVVLEPEPWTIGPFVAGMLAYGAVVRLPEGRRPRAVVAATGFALGAIMLVLVFFPFGIVLVALAVLAVWLLHRDPRVGAAAR